MNKTMEKVGKTDISDLQQLTQEEIIQYPDQTIIQQFFFRKFISHRNEKNTDTANGDGINM